MGLYHGWDHDPDKHADFVRGGVPIDDFEKEVFYGKSVKKRKNKKKAPRVRHGCPGNDNGPHVYVRVGIGDWRHTAEDFKRVYGFFKEMGNICCGCGKQKGRSQLTDEYQKHFKVTSGWMRPEYRDFKYWREVCGYNKNYAESISAVYRYEKTWREHRDHF